MSIRFTLCMFSLSIFVFSGNVVASQSNSGQGKLLTHKAVQKLNELEEKTDEMRQSGIPKSALHKYNRRERHHANLYQRSGTACLMMLAASSGMMAPQPLLLAHSVAAGNALVEQPKIEESAVSSREKLREKLAQKAEQRRKVVTVKSSGDKKNQRNVNQHQPNRNVKVVYRGKNKNKNCG